MKRFLLYSFLSMGTLSMLTGCYEDQSTEASFTIPEIEIDTVGLNAPWNDDYDRYTISIQQYDELKLSFPVSQEGVTDGDYSYEWKLTMSPEASGGAELKFMTISNEKDLVYEFTQSPNTRPYILWYQVTDNKTGIMKGTVWAIKIVSKYNEGLLVAQETAGGNTDISYIESEQFTKIFGGTNKIEHNLYSNANGGQPIEGLVNQLFWCQRSVTGQGTLNHLMLTGKDFYQHIDNAFVNFGRDGEVSYDKSQTFVPTQMGKCSGAFILVSNGKIYVVASLGKPYVSMNMPNNYTHPLTGMDTECVVDKYVAMRHWSQSNKPWGIWYDKNNGIFLYQDSNNGANTNKGMKTMPVEDYTIFDPNNSQNLETQAAGVGYNSEFYFVMKNTETQSYQVYVFDGSAFPPKPAALYNIPESENSKLAEAIGYFISEQGKVIYFATKSKVYAIRLDATVPQVVELYASSEEITHFSMFHQAWYIMGSQPEYFQEKLLDTHHNLLLVGTWNGSKGTLRTIPVINPATGDVDLGKITNYEGFGKILTVVHQQQ